MKKLVSQEGFAKSNAFVMYLSSLMNVRNENLFCNLAKSVFAAFFESLKGLVMHGHAPDPLAFPVLAPPLEFRIFVDTIFQYLQPSLNSITIDTMFVFVPATKYSYKDAF